MDISAQPDFIKTSIGKIAIYQKTVAAAQIPILFLHGVYFDHRMWDAITGKIVDRSVVAIDMPWHGASREIVKSDWTLNDCACMLIEILDQLQIEKVIAIGHSWGSMSILRAAASHPERFVSVGLCNMPFLPASGSQKLTFRLQHTLLMFRDFYSNQAARALFGKSSLQANPSLAENLKRTMKVLSNDQIRQVDKAVILDAENAGPLFAALKEKAIALMGEEDYVPMPPPGIETMLVKGGHISPLESPEEVWNMVKKLL